MSSSYGLPFDQSADKKEGLPTALGRRYKSLLLSQKYTDCTFVIGPTRHECHKLILSAASPVFDAMFYGPMREQNAIAIEDISADVFLQLLDYIYSGQTDFEHMSLETAIELYYSAEKYLLSDLIADCLGAIKSKLSFENILPALDLSVYMDLAGLQEICLTFFTRCCLNSFQFMAWVKSDNYFHVSKDCAKAIIASNRKNYKTLVWYVLEWCRSECERLGLAPAQCSAVIGDLEVEDMQMPQEKPLAKLQSSCYKISERTYYKACRPFTVTEDTPTVYIVLQPDRFIALHGVLISSRLMPPVRTDRIMSRHYHQPQNYDYTESVVVEITPERDDADVIYRHQLDCTKVRYNCDFAISWEEDVTLAANLAYRVKLTWNRKSYGAEYPCSLQANEIDGIQFKDMGSQFGSIVKGVKYLNL